MDDATTYRLKSEILAVYCDGEHRGNIYIPANCIISVEPQAPPSPLVPVLWEGRRLKLFRTDLEQRADLLAAPINTAAVSA